MNGSFSPGWWVTKCLLQDFAILMNEYQAISCTPNASKYSCFPKDQMPLTFMGFVHELKKFVDNRLKELPMCFKKAWILADNVHDVAGNHCLVVLSSLHFSESKKILDYR